MEQGTDTTFRHDETQRRINNLDGKVDKILTNDLPHIQVSLEELDKKIELVGNKVNLLLWVAGIMASTIILALVGGVLKLILTPSVL